MNSPVLPSDAPGNEVARLEGRTALDSWRAWLDGGNSMLPGNRRTAFGTRFSIPCEHALLELGHVLNLDAGLFDWLFPADRYDVTAPGMSQAPTFLSDEFPLLANGTDLRLHYVRFLALLNGTVDHHGWVLDLQRPLSQVRWTFAELNTLQVVAIARVLRMVHLAGWRGYSYSWWVDPNGYRYDIAFQSWLMSKWNKHCAPRAFPAAWLAALDNFSLPVGTACTETRPRG